MMSDQRFLKNVLLIFGFCFLFVSGVNADPGVKFWAMDVGNYWVLNGTGSLGDTWTYRGDVVRIETEPYTGQTTYYVEGHDVPGSVIDKSWYTFTSTELRRWRNDFYDDVSGWHTVYIPAGYREGDTTVAIGGSWEDACTAYFDGSAVSVTVHNDVLAYDNVTTPLGTYKAYKIHRLVTILGQGVQQDATIWFVPYIGVVKNETDNIDNNPLDYEIEELASMQIRKPIFDRDSDAKTDITVYQASTGVWYIKPSSGAAAYVVGWGGTGYTPVPGDYDGDGVTDIAAYHDSSGVWFIKPSSGAAAYVVGWGGTGYLPVTR